MKKKLFVCAFLFVHATLFARENQDKLLIEQNYIQLDPFSMGNKWVSSQRPMYNENNLQFITVRPSVLFYLNINNIILRSFISMEPASATSEGSFNVGKLINNRFEYGLYTQLTHTEDSMGSGNSRVSLISTHFLIGPSFYLYPLNSSNLLQLSARVSYEYGQNKPTVSGSEATTSSQKGANFNVGVAYSIPLNTQIYFAPNVNFTYSITAESGGNDTIRKSTSLQIVPISLQVII